MSTVGNIFAMAERGKGSQIAQATAKCRAAYRTYVEDYAKSKADHPAAVRVAHQQAAICYRMAMPQLNSLQEIHAYIACVAQGIVMQVFNGRDGSQLLYAAQVAISILDHQRKLAEGRDK